MPAPPNTGYRNGNRSSVRMTCFAMRFRGFMINGAWRFAVIARTSSGTTRMESTVASDGSLSPSSSTSGSEMSNS